MKKHYISLTNIAFAMLLMTFASTGCVSVNIGPEKPEKSEGVSYSSPGSPFAQIDTSSADRAWQNKGNGNTISYHSMCGDPADPQLETIQAELHSALEDIKIIRSETTSFNSREALSTEAEGLVDGVKTRLETMIFKKNGCTYTVSYVGVSSSFGADQGRFQNFLKSFEAP